MSSGSLKLLVVALLAGFTGSATARSVPAERPVVHRVEAGQTLYLIAKRYGVSLRSLVNANKKIKNPNVLRVGQKLIIPNGRKLLAKEVLPNCQPLPHVVGRYDTLHKIAQKHGVKSKDLWRWNKLKTSRLLVGQIILVRSKCRAVLPEPGLEHVDPTKAKQFARFVEKSAKRVNTTGKCLRGVRVGLNKLRRAHNQVPIGTLGPDAEFFRKLAVHAPEHVCREYQLADITHLSHLFDSHEGFIYLWKPNRCGFDPKSGHVEVVVDDLGKVRCSDHCRSGDRRNRCAPDAVLTFVKSCTWDRMVSPAATSLVEGPSTSKRTSETTTDEQRG